MLKNLALAVALLALPATALAQDDHPHAAKKHEHAATAHKTFPQILIEKSAELKLTDEQISKLEQFTAKMAAHHKAQMKMGTGSMKHEGHEAPGMQKMHDELLGIFTDAQREQVKTLMKKHMDDCKEGEAMHCKVEAPLKKESIN